MKLVIQRITKGAVLVNKEKISEIKNGLFVLVGIRIDDTEKDAESLAQKLIKLRVMKDTEDKMNLTVKDVNGGLLVVSQFTLYSNTKGGNRPSFIKAARSEVARPIYDKFVSLLKDYGVEAATGKFGEYMEIDIELDGPVTIIIDSKE